MFEDITKVVLVTDMDGTFLPSSKIPGEKSLKAVESFQQKGGRFSIATGRAMQAAEQYFDTVKVNCPIIMCNGGMIYDLNSRKSLYDVFLPNNTADIVKEIFSDNPNVGGEILRLDNVYVPKMNECEKEHIKICKVEPVAAQLDEIPDNWYKVLFAADAEDIDRLEEYVKNKNWDFVDFVRSTPNYFEILPKNITKGSALKKMRAICGMEDYTFVAVGDYNNDIQMLQEADVGICPSNAADDVKKIADLVLDVSCEEDVIAKVVEYIFNELKYGGFLYGRNT